MDEHQKQAVIDLPKVIAVGIASPAGATLTSRFGVAGTIVGLALSAVIITVVTDFLKVYLARVPGAVTSIPGGFRKKSASQRLVGRIRLPFSKFSSLPPERRRSLLIGSVIAGVISFIVGLIVVTGLEFGVGKSLSCWVWDECPKETSADGNEASSTSTLPSIFGGGQSTSSGLAPQAGPSNSRPQPTPGVPGSPSQTPDVSGTGGGPVSPTPGQRWSPSGNPSDYSEEQQQGEQQWSSSENSGDQQWSSSENSGDQQQNSSGGSGDQQQGSSGGSGNQQRGDQGSVYPAGDSENLR